MPTTTPVLLRGLVDDAAVYPPGNASLAEAVAGHAVHRSAWYAGCIGPLLVPAAAVADLVTVLDAGMPVPPVPCRCRHGRAARHRAGRPPGRGPRAWSRPPATPCAHDPRVRVLGAEVGWYAGWYDDLAGELPLAVEMPRGPDGDHAFAEVRTAHRDGLDVVLKFRTGPTPTWPWPDEHELAAFLRLAAPEVPFKLTGGLHHAVRGTYDVGGVPEENHGVLNVLVATSAALARAGQEEVAGLLALRDAGALADLVGAWPEGTAARVREAFTAYGCCTVTDPVGELADLGLLSRP